MAKEKVRYQIVEWIDKHITEDDYKSQQTLQDAIANLDDDYGSIGGWMSKSKDWTKDKYKGESLGDKIKSKNEDYISKIRAEIENANTTTKLKTIDLDKKYEETTQTILEEQISEKLEELGGGEPGKEGIIDTYKSIIEDAETQEDLDKIVMGDVRRKYGDDIRKIVSGLVAEKGGELETLSERAFRETSKEVDTARSKYELYGISGELMDIPNLTIDLRRELVKKIRERLTEVD